MSATPDNIDDWETCPGGWVVVTMYSLVLSYYVFMY